METTHENEAAVFLKEELHSRKKNNKSYSLRAFAHCLQISPAQLSQLLSGKRNFTPDVLALIARRLRLSPEEEHRLTTRALAPRKLPLYLEKEKRQLQEDEFRVIADWYHFAILSLSKVRGATADAFWISERLGITVAEAKAALERLVRLKIIDEGKVLKQISAPLNVVSDVPSRAIQAYHQNILQLAGRKLENVPIEKRDFSAMTFTADPTKITEVRKMIEEFQDRITDVMGTASAKEVYVLSTQLFSLEKDA